MGLSTGFSAGLSAGFGSAAFSFTFSAGFSSAGFAAGTGGGGKAGTVKASGELHLEEQDGRTVIDYTGDAQITGLIASVGHRLIGGVAKQMAQDFFKALERELTK